MLAQAFASQYTPDPRIPGLGLAFFRVDAGGRAVVEHQGVLPGFDSQVLVAPDDGVAVMAFTNGMRQGGFWLPAETGRLLDDLLGIPAPGVRTDVPHHPEVWADLCGWYTLPGPLSDLRVRMMMGAGVQVFVRRGRLALRFLTPVPALAGGSSSTRTTRTTPTSSVSTSWGGAGHREGGLRPGRIRPGGGRALRPDAADGGQALAAHGRPGRDGGSQSTAVPGSGDVRL